MGVRKREREGGGGPSRVGSGVCVLGAHATRGLANPSRAYLAYLTLRTPGTCLLDCLLATYPPIPDARLWSALQS